MPASNPEVFDLLIERSDVGYRARVLGSPAGNAAADLESPVTEQELESFLFRVGRPRRTVRRGGSSVATDVRAFGERLFGFLFPPPIAGCLRTSLVASRITGIGLRIQIRLSDVPELADLPWELLYQGEAEHLALSAHTPLVRFLETGQPLQSLRVIPPLRVLAVISDPSDYPSLDVEREWDKLAESTKTAASKGLLQLDRLDTPRLAKLNRHLRSTEYHILHFVGHGDFDQEQGVGELIFEDERGRAARVTAGQLSAALRDHRSLRLVVLNACEGARASRRDPFAGTAQTLVRSGIPAVVAMQFEVTDDAAITFASEFYSSLAVGDPVDHALSEARKGIFFDGNPLEWATPVLYLRAATGRIFEIPPTDEVELLRGEQDVHRKAHKQAAQQEVEDKAPRETAQREAEERARRETAQREAEEQARRETAQREAEAQARRETAQREAEAQARRETAPQKKTRKLYVLPSIPFRRSQGNVAEGDSETDRARLVGGLGAALFVFGIIIYFVLPKSNKTLENRSAAPTVTVPSPTVPSPAPETRAPLSPARTPAEPSTGAEVFAVNGSRLGRVTGVAYGNRGGGVWGLTTVIIDGSRRVPADQLRRDPSSSGWILDDVPQRR